MSSPNQGAAGVSGADGVSGLKGDKVCRYGDHEPSLSAPALYELVSCYQGDPGPRGLPGLDGTPGLPVSV